MTKDVLLIFLDAPFANSKLAQSLGDKMAAEIQEKVQTVILDAVENTACEKIVFSTREKNFQRKNFKPELQEGNYLNEKVNNAFNRYIVQDKSDINKVVFITSDCPRLNAKIVEQAFESLNKYDVCIGPEKKGTYYLIGMKEPLPFLFDNKLWSGNHLLDDTLEELIEHGKNYFLLPELQSVSDIYDLHLVK